VTPCKPSPRSPNILVGESRRKNRGARVQRPEADDGRGSFLNRNAWEDTVRIMPVDENEEEEEKLEAESEGESRPPPEGGAIVLDDVSINT